MSTTLSDAIFLHLRGEKPQTRPLSENSNGVCPVDRPVGKKLKPGFCHILRPPAWK